MSTLGFALDAPEHAAVDFHNKKIFCIHCNRSFCFWEEWILSAWCAIRKRLFVLLLVCALFLGGCDKSVPQDYLLYEGETFTLLAQGTIGEATVAFALRHDVDGTVTVRFVEPADFVNLTYTVYCPQQQREQGVDIAKSGIVVCYDGIEIPLSAGEAPQGILAVAQCFWMKSASMTECDLEPNGTDTRLSFSCDAGTATLILDGTLSLPKSLRAHLYGVELCLDFSEIARIQSA